ncbi:DUF1800 domain-containing protein [Jannaschia donghaensis]|uniref:DUF1800 domain-containing protein n=1 Tax=Jannaschia donghaensis TaxID=420998 RepID=A0A0M6YI34_9RHOB|nr:DUF1800 domain-containing protein [Jannaschia donghaensis]CTQ48716.1 hypothetical protein JDO7802_00720 [Jannaschia donghaensis]
MKSTLAAIRFGTGLSPDHAPPAGAAAILADLDGPDTAAATFAIVPWSARMATIQDFGRRRRERRDGDAQMEAFRVVNRRLSDGYHRDLMQTLRRAATAPVGFRDRLAWFWAGHFAVADGAGHLRRSVGSYHDGAIRPNVSGRFADLLRAAVTHPAMLAYLDQSRSIGPNSPRGRRGGGVNENLAREVLELHTLGVDGGYDQTDVRQLSELLTGLGIDRNGKTTFRASFVEPGSETVMGRAYGGDTPNRHDIAEVLEDLSVHPATARHLSRKLAVHFIADVPPADMVEAMAATWARTGGMLRAVYATMLDHPAAWDPELRKARKPLDMVAAALRATGSAGRLSDQPMKFVRDNLTSPLERMGQPWLRPPGPDGWPEEAAAWITPQGLAARLDWITDFVGWLDPVPDPRAFVDTALGPLAGPRTRFAADAAEDRAAGVGLILASPNFQRR